MRRLNLAFFTDLGARVDAMTDFPAADENRQPFQTRLIASRARELLQLLGQPQINPMQMPVTAVEVGKILHEKHPPFLWLPGRARRLVFRRDLPERLLKVFRIVRRLDLPRDL